MRGNRKLINVVLLGFVVLTLAGMLAPLFSRENEPPQELQNLNAKIEALKSELVRKSSIEGQSDADYSRLRVELLEVENKVSDLADDLTDDVEWNWYSDLVAPLCWLGVAGYFLYQNNRGLKVGADPS